ncbi:MAG: NAD-dependent deacylase [Bacteroidales bacterium]|nr:NAD-dependent deacylase [Bacteroidales bacterium]
MQNRIVVLTGAGISAESGIKTFRDDDGLWKHYRFEEVASPEAWHKHPGDVLEFYNQRRKNVIEAEPNAAHMALVNLEDYFDVKIITQNVDDLHERAGSKDVIHLHGEIRKARSSNDPSLIYPVEGWELNMGDKAEDGSQLRPHVVWFGEPVPMFDIAIEMAREADILLIIGTSLNVYPAASIYQFAGKDVPKFYVDPEANKTVNIENLKIMKEKAGTAVPDLVTYLIDNFK